MVDPGDVVAVEDPTFSLYADLVAAAGGQLRTFGRTADGALDRHGVVRAIDGARLVVVCQPANPSGTIFSADDWLFLAESTAGAGTLVMSDEAYSALVYPGNDFTSILDVSALEDRAILCQTFSKTYAMTGWRVGYLIGPASVIRSAALVQRTLNGSLNTAVQHAAVAALRDGAESVREMVAIYAQRRNLMAGALDTVNGLEWRMPAGAFYFLCRYEGGLLSVEVAARARKAGVLVRPGSEFGSRGEGHIRLSFAGSDAEIIEGIDRLSDVVASLACGAS